MPDLAGQGSRGEDRTDADGGLLAADRSGIEGRAEAGGVMHPEGLHIRRLPGEDSPGLHVRGKPGPYPIRLFRRVSPWP